MPSGAFDHDLPIGFPVPLAPLVGREEEVRAVGALLARPEVRLVVLTGPAGVGKTRLALAAAREAASAFPDGVRLIALAAVGDPDLVVPTIARAFEVDPGAGRLLPRLAAALRGRRLLLVLDNFEHLLPAALPLAGLLEVCPDATALVTSRATLGVTGEHAVDVPPLARPPAARAISPADLDRFPATRLFVERARAAAHDFAPTDADARAVAEICRRLDGLPLAIELAAARTPLLPPAALLDRLDRRLPLLGDGPRDQPARLRTMRDAIAWSYDQLAPAEQALFRRLSVFVGGFTLEAADALVRGWRAGAAYPIAPGRDPAIHWWLHWGRESPKAREPTPAPPLPAIELDPLAGIAALHGQSLLRRVDQSDGEPRYEMLETIREFGLDRLESSGELFATCHAHAAWALAFAELAGPELWNSANRHWVERVEAELGNLRTALGWATGWEAGAELGLRLAETLWLFWQTRGLVGEGRAWLERALARGGGPAWERAAALNVAGLFAWIQDDLGRAETAEQEALGYWRAIGHAGGVGRSLLILALVAWRHGDYPRMAALAEEAMAAFREWDDRIGMGICSVLLALLARARNDVGGAMALLDQAYGFCRDVGFGWGIATSRYYAAEFARAAGDVGRSSSRYAEAIELYRAEGDPWGIAASIAGLAIIAGTAGEATRAARLFGAADALREKAGAFLPTVDPAGLEEAQAAVRRRLGDGPFAAAFAAGRALSAAEAVAEALRRARGARRVGTGPLLGDLTAGAGLTRRERQVLPLLAAGRSNREIAEALFISERTVERPIEGVLHKLRLTRRELVAWYAARTRALEEPDGSPAARP